MSGPKKLNLLLTGFPRSGKSTVGKILARRWNYSWRDLDKLIEEHYFEIEKKQLRCKEIWNKHGEFFFREIESKSLSHFLKHEGGNSDEIFILSLGGGALLQEKNQKIVHRLKKEKPFYIIHLNVSPKILYSRLKKTHFPKFINPQNTWQSFMEHYETRLPVYSKMSDFETICEGKTEAETADEIEYWLNSKE